MYEERFASRQDVDAGMKLGATRYGEFRREHFTPSPLPRLMNRIVAAGKLGRKSGTYEYR